MLDLSAQRTQPLGTKRLANENAYIRSATPCSRLSIRCETKDQKGVEKALGAKLPTKPKTSISKNGIHSLWVGPDEWLIYCDDERDFGPKLARMPEAASAVDIGHRNTAIIVSGPKGQAVLAAGCPQNLNDDVFPVGACSRTVFGKVEVLIHRIDQVTWRVECWRSFSQYVWDLAADSLKLNAS